MKRFCVLLYGLICMVLTIAAQPDVVFGESSRSSSNYNSYKGSSNLSNYNSYNSSSNKYSTLPVVENIYYKNESGITVKLKIWKKGNYSSGDSRIDNYMESLIRQRYGEDSGWGAELSPDWKVYLGTKLTVYDDYFELKQTQYQITTIIKVARDLSWVSGYDSRYDIEVIFDKKATKHDYDKSCKALEKLYNQTQYGGGNASSFNSTTSKPEFEKLPKRHGYAVCKGCGGNGRCKTCDGTGKRASSEYDAVLGRSVKTIENCAVCRGTGNCGVCHGYGRIPY